MPSHPGLIRCTTVHSNAAPGDSDLDPADLSPDPVPIRGDDHRGASPRMTTTRDSDEIPEGGFQYPPPPEDEENTASFMVYHNPEADIEDPDLEAAFVSEDTRMDEPSKERASCIAKSLTHFGSIRGCSSGGGSSSSHANPLHLSICSLADQTSNLQAPPSTIEPPMGLKARQAAAFSAFLAAFTRIPAASVLPPAPSEVPTDKDCSSSAFSPPTASGLVPVSPLKDALLARQKAALPEHHCNAVGSAGGSSGTNSSGFSDSSKVSTLGWFGEKRSRGNGGGRLWGAPLEAAASDGGKISSQDDSMAHQLESPTTAQLPIPTVLTDLTAEAPPPIRGDIIGASEDASENSSQQDGIASFFRPARPTMQSPRGTWEEHDLRSVSPISPSQPGVLEGYFHSPDFRPESTLRVVASLIAELRDESSADPFTPPLTTAASQLTAADSSRVEEDQSFTEPIKTLTAASFFKI